MMNSEMYTVGDKTTMKHDKFIVEIEGDHIKVFKRGLIRKKIFEA